MGHTLPMRSKSFLAVIWAVATVVAVAIVWQSLGFVSTRTEDDGTALGGGSTTSVVAAPASLTAATSATDAGGDDPAATTAPATLPGGSIPGGDDPGATTSTTSSTGAAVSTTLAAGVPADAVDQTFELVGGTAVVRYSSTGVTVLYAVPANGYQAKVEPDDGGMKVEFRSKGHRSRVVVWWDNGPQHSVQEGGEGGED